MKVAKITQTMEIECLLPLDSDDEEELVHGQLPADKVKELRDNLYASHQLDAGKVGAKLVSFDIQVKVSDV